MIHRNKKKKTIEYEDAPSGAITFYNYKEPLMKFPEGHGFIGALIFDAETDMIQCHFCGKWYKSLPNHISKEHNMKAAAYKQKVGLFQTTALISESMRSKLIASGLDKRLQNLRKGGKMKATVKAKIRKTLKQNAFLAEAKNLRNTCPAQIIDRMQHLYSIKGDNLSMKDFDGFRGIITKTYGSIKAACEIANIPYRIPGTNKTYDHVRKYVESDAINFIKEYVIRFNKIPTYTDFKTQNKLGLYASQIKKLNNLKILSKKALLSLNEYKHIEQEVKYTKEELLEFLRKFKENNERLPSTSDCKRKLLPSASRYIYHFKSWKKALKIAFPKK